MNNWWIDYFESWTDIQPSIKTKETTTIEVDFIHQILEDCQCKTVLDVPCGEGRIAIELAKRGFETYGLEFNQKAIDIGLSNVKNTNLPVSLAQGDMRTMTFDKEFDSVICIFNSFGYFEEAENEQFIKQVSKALKVGGYFLMDTHVLETLLPVITPKASWQAGEYMIVEKRLFDYSCSRLKGRWVIMHDEKDPKIYESSVRIYSYLELTRLLKKYGFDNFEPYGDFDGKLFDMGDEGLLLLAQKVA